MEIIYTDHARLRINHRDLSRHQIETTILQPDKVLPSFKERRLARKDFGKKTLEVVYRKSTHKIVIITAYWLKEV